MATSTITFNAPLIATSRAEAYCDLPFTPPSNLAGKLCYVQARAFNAIIGWSGSSAWNTLLLYNDWPQVQCAQVDYDPNAQDFGSFTCTTTTSSKTLTSVDPPIGYVVGTEIRGTGITSGTTVESYSGSTIVMTNAFTGTGGSSQSLVFLAPSGRVRQLANGPIAANNGYGFNPFKTLVQIPDGPHTVRFRVKRADKGSVTNSTTTSPFSMYAIFEIVPANGRQTPI